MQVSTAIAIWLLALSPPPLVAPDAHEAVGPALAQSTSSSSPSSSSASSVSRSASGSVSDASVSVSVSASSASAASDALRHGARRSALAESSSMLGAAQVVLTLGHFAKDVPDADGLAAFRKQDHGTSLSAVPTVWWLYLSLLLALGVGGAWLQLLPIAKPDEYATMTHV